jgi:hypothetical protein
MAGCARPCWRLAPPAVATGLFSDPASADLGRRRKLRGGDGGRTASQVLPADAHRVEPLPGGDPGPAWQALEARVAELGAWRSRRFATSTRNSLRR